VFTSVSTCLFGKFCCILREKYLPGDSPPAHFYLVCNKIMLENPHIFLVKTGSETFQENSMRVEACVFNLMQIGELAKISLSEEAKAEISTIPWKQLYGMRNRIVHGYSGVDMRIVWDTISSDLPQLRQEIEPHLN
ncbi:MAG: DUF86 domain-containing protein, partial [Ruminococcus sp.]